MNSTKIVRDILEGQNVRDSITKALYEALDLKKFECKDCQKVPYGEWKSDIPCSIQAGNDRLIFRFWNTNKDDVDEVLQDWAKENNLSIKSIENKKEVPVDGGNVWLQVEIVVD